ncbi:hypothetical protein [Conexibacter sp. DBS9H8]|uniref:hypothetical protein n=1 Tax=Conexibacter sp. DBS9H8 TaxID=2937801 RepID=UPI00200EC39F|nr:hypothetical protein [Conexibacter sp. DBS9H8]
MVRVGVSALAVTLACGLLGIPLAQARSVRGPAPISTSPTQVVAIMSGAEAARLVGPIAEIRAGNRADNRRVPSQAQLRAFRAHDHSMPRWYLDRITGDYRGSTSQIIAWAAIKWGLDPNLLRAVAAVESWWEMSTRGDGGHAFGLFQLDARYHCCADLAAGDTAFDADYYGAIIRSYYDGTQSWLNTVSGNGARYGPHELWFSLGFWDSGRWDTPIGRAYVHQVQRDLAEQIWRLPSFDGH